jgi:hypothetical protein
MALPGLNKQQIEVIAQTSRDRYKVRIFEQFDLWQVTVTLLTDPSQDFLALTSRGDLKTWRELSGAIRYIQETCPDCQLITVEVGSWKFLRSDNF